MSVGGRKILIVGGASGMGLACTELFASRGDEVIVASRNPKRAQAALGRHPNVRLMPVDAGDRAAIDALFAAIGSIDHVVVTVAGGIYMGPFAQMDAAALASTLQGKLLPYLNVTAGALPALAPRGSLTLITGQAARRAAPNAASLALVNGALESLVITLAVEFAPRRINAVSPGTTATTAWERMPAEARRGFFAAAEARTPLGRVGQPEDVACAVAALMETEFITGAVLPVDGGASLV